MIEAPIRLVATDLDGTLLHDDGTISPRTRRAISRAQEAGITVVLVTARPPRTLHPLAEQAGVHGPAICCNGAIVYDVTTQTVIGHWPLATTVAQRLVTGLRTAIPEVCFAVERGLQSGQEPAYAALQPVAGDHPSLVDEALMLCAEEVTKLLILHPRVPLTDLLHLTRQIAGDAATVTHSSTLFVEVSAVGVTKASTLQHLCAQLKIPATHVVACGDMPNDRPMLEWAGHSVAVANAHPGILAIADEVTATNNDDGVAHILERLVA
jgi:Cof subfamily protein (haloacid dehalogenase superfamily)